MRIRCLGRVPILAGVLALHAAGVRGDGDGDGGRRPRSRHRHHHDDDQGHGHDHDHHDDHDHDDDHDHGRDHAHRHASVRRCGTVDPTAEEEAEAAEAFGWWLEERARRKGGRGKRRKREPMPRPAKDERGGYVEAKGGPRGAFRRRADLVRRMAGCGNADCVDWDTQTITVPVHFHVFHDGNAGRQFLCRYAPDSGFVDGAGGSCSHVREQIRVLNRGFGGAVQDAQLDQDRLYHADTRLRFCLASVNAEKGAGEYDSAGFYTDADAGYKGQGFRSGGTEALNVWAGAPRGGVLGYATFPGQGPSDEDGVVILNDSMPGGNANLYNEGDTLTHEVGHWLHLKHTFEGGCNAASLGDYNDLAGYGRTKEGSANSGCNPGRDTCPDDGPFDTRDKMGGQDPIHNFMDYSYDNCMDEFNPGQALRMQSAWEIYRHKAGESEAWRLSADGVTCTQGPTPPPTSPPSPPPTATPPPCTALRVDVTTDGYSAETSWDLFNECTSQVQEARPAETYFLEPYRDYRDEYCVPYARYTFTIRDSYSDGICCGHGEGRYEVSYDGASVAAGEQFSDEDKTTFGSCNTVTPPPPDPTKAPTDAPTPPPTQKPTNNSMPVPNPTKAPVDASTPPPTREPTKKPTTPNPTKAPTDAPTPPPPTREPTKKPTTSNPTKALLSLPTAPPTSKPATLPTPPPTPIPASIPPTPLPLATPTNSPTGLLPTYNPTSFPTTDSPSESPSDTTSTAPAEAPITKCSQEFRKTRNAKAGKTETKAGKTESPTSSPTPCPVTKRGKAKAKTAKTSTTTTIRARKTNPFGS